MPSAAYRIGRDAGEGRPGVRLWWSIQTSVVHTGLLTCRIIRHWDGELEIGLE